MKKLLKKITTLHPKLKKLQVALVDKNGVGRFADGTKIKVPNE